MTKLGDGGLIDLAVLQGMARDMLPLVKVMTEAKNPKDAYAAWHYITHYYAERIDSRFEQFDSQDLGWVGDVIQFPKLQDVLAKAS